MTTIDITLPRVLSIDEQEELSKQLYWVTDTVGVSVRVYPFLYQSQGEG